MLRKAIVKWYTLHIISVNSSLINLMVTFDGVMMVWMVIFLKYVK